MQIPKGKTEKEVLDIIANVANRLARKFMFGYHSFEDMKQQATLHALKGLDNYDGVRPLENFLWVHVRNRLYNDKRNNFARPDIPCYTCPFYNIRLKSKCDEYVDKMECDIYQSSYVRNEAKKNLMSTTTIDNILIDNEKNMKLYDDNFETKELLDIIDTNISVDFREDWIRLKEGLKLPKIRKDKLLGEIYIILEESSVNLDDWEYLPSKNTTPHHVNRGGKKYNIE